MVNELDDLMQSRASYLNHKLLTVPVSRKQQRTSYNRSLENTLSFLRRVTNEERPNGRAMNSAPLPYQAPPHARVAWERDNPACLHSGPSESSAVLSLSRRTAVIVTNFCIFRVQQRCKHLSCLLFTCAYQLSLLYTYTSLLYTHISLLYTCSNLLTVNVIALNTVPPGTGE